jgi:DNA repair protein RadC
MDACVRRGAVTMSIKKLPSAARPREKLLALGPQALADVELLALLLRTGLPGGGVFELARALLERCGGLAGLLRADVQLLTSVKGIGPAKRAELAAVFEIARRALGAQLAEAPVFDNPVAVKQFAALAIGALGFEVFAVLFLDNQHRLLKHEEMFRGTLTQTSVYPREVVRRALELNSAAVIFAHNHPSGAAEPSRADEFLTQSLKAALQLVDIRVLDHLVVGRGEVVSFAERGLL